MNTKDNKRITVEEGNRRKQENSLANWSRVIVKDTPVRGEADHQGTPHQLDTETIIDRP